MRGARLENIERARFWLDAMIEAQITPNRVTYTVLLEAYCRIGDLTGAENILRQMISLRDDDTRPDCVTYSALINGWAKIAARHPEAAYASVARLLEEMKRRGRKWPDTLPNARTYTSVLTALARTRHSAAATQAEYYLNEMERSGLRPTVIHYNAVLDAHAKSPRADKALQAASILEHMDVEPDIISYNSVLAAASNSFGKQSLKTNSLKTALGVFSVLRKSCQPTSLSYYYLAKATRRLLANDNPERHRLTCKLFRLCCDDGCLNNRILRQILEQLSEVEVRDLIPGVHDCKVRVCDLPVEWSKNSLQDR